MSKNKFQSRVFDILGLSPAERKIIAHSEMAKSLPAISRAAAIPPTSLPYMLSKLARRGLMKKISESHSKGHSEGRTTGVIWKSNLDATLRELQSCAHMYYNYRYQGLSNRR